jgi:hypothetical protein
MYERLMDAHQHNLLSHLACHSVPAGLLAMEL